MKRDKNLETLSWEHHDGLVVALRIKKGLERQADPDEMIKYVLHIWENLLVGHFRREETALVELLRRTEKGKHLADRLLQEHELFRRIIGEFRRHGSEVSGSLQDFAELLSVHIRFEEKEVFPAVEQQASPEELQKIGAYLKEQHVLGDKDWPVEFWK